MEFNDLGLPKFDEMKVFEVDLPVDLHVASDEKQFREAINYLKEELRNNYQLRRKFTEEQFNEIMNNTGRISDYTWHHHEVTGKLQFLPSNVHKLTKHTGGNVFWSEGKR
ncbi:HNH endonuclease [Macrococcus capreoli]